MTNRTSLRSNKLQKDLVISQSKSADGKEKHIRKRQSKSIEDGMMDGRKKKRKENRPGADDITPTSGSQCGLEEVELSQSDPEEGGSEILSTVSNRSDENRNIGLTSVPQEERDGNTDPVEEIRKTIPLSHRRSEMAKSREPRTSSDVVIQSEIIEERNNNISPSSPDDDLQPLTSSGNLSNPGRTQHTTSLNSAYNAMKAEVLELKRDKRAYSSAIITLKEKSDQMVKDLHMKGQQIVALEEALSRKRNNGGIKKGLPWSMESLSKYGMDRYQGICLAAAKYGTKLAKLLVTESFIDEKDEHYQKQDWTPSSTKVTNENAHKAVVCVKLPDGVLAIPRCNMIRAMKAEFFTSRLTGSIGLLKASLLSTLEGPVGSYLNESERTECISKVSAHRPSIQKYQSIISDAIGNRKKSARNVYLKSLGYRHASTPDSKKDTSIVRELRNEEKATILKRCSKEGDENDTTYWRTSGWESLCLGAASDEVGDDMISAENMLEDDGKIDNLFMNEAARRAFLVLRGYSVSSSVDEFSADTSMLYLARADAAMTTMLKFINVKGKGGSRNDRFVESFRFLLPRALAVVIRDIWTDLQLLAPHELSLNIGDSGEDSVDPYGNSLRDWTVVQKDPSDNHIYLVASPRYFREKVCSWYGNVKDGHIGRYDSLKRKFIMITSTIANDEFEDSDIEDGLIE